MTFEANPAKVARINAERRTRITPPDQASRIQPPESEGCKECALGVPIYIPCGKPAEFMIENRGEVIPMCRMCADHNVRNRGAIYQRKETP